MKAQDWVTLKNDRGFQGRVLLDPQGGTVYVVVAKWGNVSRTRDGIIGLAEADLEVIQITLRR